MFKLFQSKSNAVHVIHSIVKRLKIPLSFYTIQNDLQEHPDYPSLLALTDCLTSWNIPNEAFKFDKRNCKIEELPVPFIAVINNNKKTDFIFVDKIQNECVKFSSTEKGNGILSTQEFIEQWDGVILYAEKDELSGEPDYKQSLIKGLLNQARLPFLTVMTFAMIISSLLSKDMNSMYLLLIILKLSGVVISCFLLIYNINSSNPFIANLCSFGGKKNDCNAILKSNAAKVTDWLNWSEVGMFYFAGSFLYLLCNPSNLNILSWLNILCLPYTFYSIGFQIKIKNWCLLCCSIQALLWLEALTFYSGGFSFHIQTLQFSFVDFTSFLFCFFMPIAIWSFIKPFFLKAGQVQPLKHQLKKFKYNSTLFNTILSSQKKYDVPDELMPLKLGNTVAENIITVVSNPLCNPCATTHKILDEWISQRDDIQLKILFMTANVDDEKRTKVARHLTALSLLNDQELVGHALNAWYNQDGKKYESWAESYPVVYDEKMSVVTEKQNEWCDMAEISFTPTIFVNGYKLIDPYRLEDIKYLLY